MANEQATSVPFSPDVRAAHDSALVFSREFGTNVQQDLGQPFGTTAAPSPQPVVAVNARTGMLEINSFGPGIGEFAQPRGNTYLIPEWSTFPPSPFLGTTVIVVYCHLILREVHNASGAQEPLVDLILGGTGLVGDSPAEEFGLVSVDGSLTVPPGAPGDFAMSDWLTGPLGPATEEDADGWGRDAYYRLVVSSDGATSTTWDVWWSRDGLTWNEVTTSFNLPATVFRRIGLACRGFCIGALDWVRIYTFPNITSVPGLSTFFIPPIPETGGRLYIP